MTAVLSPAEWVRTALANDRTIGKNEGFQGISAAESGANYYRGVIHDYH